MPVKGISVIKGPNKSNVGQFNLPTNFDSRVHVAKWAREGQEVEYFQQRQVIVGSQLDSDGWQVWKDPKTKEPYRQAKTRDGAKFVLMFRDKVLQKEVNAIYGDLSKASVYMTQTGEAPITSEAGQRIPGMLTEADLKSLDGPNDEIPTVQNNSPSSQKVGSVTKTQSTKE